MTIVKTFIEALSCVSSTPQRIKIYLKDKRLSQSEKIILQAWLDLRDNKYGEVICQLENLETINNPIILSQRDLLLGNTYNNRGESHRAICLLKSAIHLLSDFPLPQQQFNARINLFTAYFNYKDLKGMQSVLHELKQLKCSNQSDQINLLSCWYNYYSFNNQLNKCENCLEELKTLQKHMSDNQRANYFLKQFDFCLKIDDFKSAEIVLDDFKKCRKFYNKANYRFMKSLLDHLLYDKPIYAYDREFHEGTQLINQLKVIKSLEENDVELALSYWKKLMLFNSSIYQEDFKYHGNKSLFSLCLAKYSQKIKDIADTKIIGPVTNHQLPKLKEDALVFLLRESKIPLKRDELYEKLWGTPIEDKSDLKRLTQMISKLRKTKNINISIRKGCYILDKKAA